jgi:outer membrane receptor for ferrienterochelin and colicins
MKLNYIALLWLLAPLLLWGQQQQATFSLQGTILAQESPDQEVKPVTSARVFILNTRIGTLTNEKGEFQLKLPKTQKEGQLVIQAAGFQTDTLLLDFSEGADPIELTLAAYSTEEVTIKSREKGTRVSRVDPVKTEMLGELELSKAACCNLSESFETNATVDVAFADAVTGAKRIKMLGLDGVYTQILTEAYPSIRGLATTFGLTAIPGPWMQGLQVSKGTASVRDGYESLTGQINVELHKPQNADRLYLNLYGNNLGRAEASLNLSHRFSPRLSTMLMAHGNRFSNPLDNNGDGFRDLPGVDQYSFINRWRWHSGKSWRGQVGVKFFEEARLGGQTAFDPEQDRGQGSVYGAEINTRRWEAFNKAGYVFPNNPKASLGTTVSASLHEQEAILGMNRYQGEQRSLYAKALIQTPLRNDDHQVTAGFNFLYDGYQESFNDSAFSRTEKVPGVFTEYTYNRLNRLIFVAGMRFDFHNLYGPIFTPRLHFKYDLDPKTTLRASAGSGFRVPNALAENIPVLVSSRIVRVSEALDPERGWNYGFNLIRYFSLAQREGNISLDVYRTDFLNQLVVNRETAGLLVFENLEGRSFANAVQVEAFYEPLDRFEVRLAWKWNQVKSTFDGALLDMPFVVRHRALLNLGYHTPENRWQFDVTLQGIGKRRLPNTDALPEQYRLPEEAPAFIDLHAQVTKRFDKIEFYLGGENLTGFRQEAPIIAPDAPFGPNFDAAMTWGPIVGTRVYAGLRLKIAGNQAPGL